MDVAHLVSLDGQVGLKGSDESFNLSDYLRSTAVDDVSCVSDGFNETDGEEAVRCLRKCFQILEPGSHITRRMPDHGGTSFIHCRHSASLGRHYLNVRFQLEERARIELMRDCMFRLKTAVLFVKGIQQLVKEEFATLQSVTHDTVHEIPVSKIYCLSSLCEELRNLIGHWNCIKQKLHTNRWLQSVLGSMYFQLEKIKLSMLHLQNKAVWWLEKFVFIGLQVFAHSNIETVSHDMISNLVRGVEDMNRIIGSLQNRTSNTFSKTGIHLFMGDRMNTLSPLYSNSVSNIGEHVRAIPLMRVLTVVATERSKYAALAAHRFFTTSQELVRLLYSGKLPDYIWTEDSSQRSVDKIDRDTSDYHTATGSMTSLSAAILKVGSLRAPDLSEMESPLVELARREQMFAEDFLNIICNCTSFLRKNENSQKSRHNVKYSQSVCISKPPRSDTPVLSRSDSLRKSVSWGDSDVGSVKSQVISRYLDLFWSHFGTNLYMMFYEPCWVRQKSLYFSELGSMLLLNTTVMALIKHMIQHVCLKGPLNMRHHPIDPRYPNPGVPMILPEPEPDVFPQGCILPMLNAARKCLHTAAFDAWDTLMCETLASQQTDKCYPCPLVDGDFSTHTGRLLRDTYQPMLHLLRENLSDGPDPLPGGLPASLDEMVAVATRLVATCNVSLHWCRTKTHQYLASMTVGTFLLISQTDLKILVDETKTSIYQTQMVTKSLAQRLGPESVNDLNSLSSQLSVLMDCLQSLSGQCMKEFATNFASKAQDYFQANMPVGKVWRRKADSGTFKNYPRTTIST